MQGYSYHSVLSAIIESWRISVSVESFLVLESTPLLYLSLHVIGEIIVSARFSIL